MPPAARFTIITPHCIRLEFSPSGHFVDAPSLFAAARPADAPSHTVRPNDPPLTIDTSAIRLTYTPDTNPFNDTNLRALISTASPHPRVPASPRPPVPPSPSPPISQLPPLTHSPSHPLTWSPSSRQTSNLRGTLQTLDQVRTRVPLPDGLLSRDGWFLLDDSRTHLLIDNWAAPRPHPENTDWYLLGYGDDYPAALRALAAVAGPVPMPRRYTLGSWYSRYWPYTSPQYRQIVHEYDRRALPLDVIVLDMDWHKPGWTGWSWNRDLLPDAEELLEWLHSQGLFVTLNLHPADGVAPHEDAYPAFMRSLGRNPASRQTLPFDAGDPHYAHSLFKFVHEPLEDRAPRPGKPGAGTVGPRGVDFWWLDWQQFPFTRSIPDLSNLAWLNHLYFRHTSQHNTRGTSFSRWAGWGDHRHPVHFSGDSHTGWDSLTFQVPFTSTAGNVGCFFWSHDIGGHFGPRIEEATTRWVQFGALSAALRLHSARSGALDRRPWTYAPQYEAAMTSAFQLRARLFPYIYTAVRQCYADSLPLLRPMYLAHPREETAYRCPQQYMLGDHLLVAPITSPGLGKRKVATQAVWFPPSFLSAPLRHRVSSPYWFNWFTAERFAAGTEHLISADIDKIPLFVPGGVPIPLQPPTLRMATARLDHVIIRLFPGEPGTTFESTLYEDDGATDDYKSGRFATTPLRAEWSRRGETGPHTLVLTIGPTTGEFDGQVPSREYTVELAGAATVMENADSPSAAIQPSRIWRMQVPAHPVREPVTVSPAFTPLDFDWNNREHRLHQPANTIDETLTVDEINRAFFQAAAGLAIRHDPDHHEYRVYNSGGFADNGRISLTITDRLGPTATTLVQHLLTVDPARPSVAPAPMNDLGTPPTGLVARREAALEFLFRGKPLSLATILATASTPLTSWKIAGPFPFTPTRPLADQHHPPELASPPSSVAWRPAPSPPPGDHFPIDFRHAYGSKNGEGLAYARTTFRSPERQPAALLLESGDRLEVWLNGAKVFSNDSSAAAETPTDRAPVTLDQGDNTLLVKTTEGGGGWGFRLAIDGRHPISEAH